MKRTPETIERFRIAADAELIEVGPLLAALTKLGLKNIQYELITDVINFRTNRSQAQVIDAEAPQPQLALPAPEKVKGKRGGGSARFGVSGDEVVWRHIKNRKAPFKVEELRILFRAQGRTENSASPCIDKLLKRGLLKRVEPGVYQRTAATWKLPRKVGDGTKKNIQKPRHAVSNRALIFNHIGDKTTFTTAEIKQLFADNGRPWASGSSLISQLRTDGFTKLNTDGTFTVLRRPKSQLNGAGVQAHG